MSKAPSYGVYCPFGPPSAEGVRLSKSDPSPEEPRPHHPPKPIAKIGQNEVPRPVILPADKIVIHGTLRCQVMRQHIPLAATALQLVDGVHDLTQFANGRPAVPSPQIPDEGEEELAATVHHRRH